MTGSKRFFYPLEPVLLMRQWARDALVSDLSRINTSISAMHRELAMLDQEDRETASAWNQRACNTDGFSPAAYAVVTAYLRDRAQQGAVRQSMLDALEQDALVVVQKMVDASNALRAVEQHRDHVHQNFDKASARAECRLADEQWAARPACKEFHEA
jgi:flagellar export protein FliJ